MTTKRPPAPPPRLPGFTFVEVLGSGGFADVYLYEQQLPRYERAAGEALDQSAIPPHLKDYVRDYFSNLEPKR